MHGSEEMRKEFESAKTDYLESHCTAYNYTRMHAAASVPEQLSSLIRMSCDHVYVRHNYGQNDVRPTLLHACCHTMCQICAVIILLFPAL